MRFSLNNLSEVKKRVLQQLMHADLLALNKMCDENQCCDCRSVDYQHDNWQVIKKEVVNRVHSLVLVQF